MKMIYTHENRLMTHNIKNLLEAKGIEVTIKNDFLQGAVGELSAFDAWSEVWVVNEAQFDHAESIIKEGLSEQYHGSWTCSHCSESNEASFEVCWNCQTERP
ncbi:putative signal transducing protein [Thalassotalea fusca]